MNPRRRLSSKFESLDYNVVESQRFLQEKELVTAKKLQRATLVRWGVNFLIGVYVAVIAVLVAVLITYLSRLKFMAVYSLLKDCENVGCLIPALLVWILINVGLVALGSYLVCYHAPQAAGSGIPNIKCYLNGIRLPGLLSLKTLVAKAGGVVLSVAGGLACGKEGPMIHSGAICASGLAHGEFGCGSKKFRPKCMDPLRSDEERRDFVTAGAASGVSAAFASPVGGVLFSLEEGASFLKQMLTWRMLFSSMTASLVLNIIISALKGHPENLSSPGLTSFGYIGDVHFQTWDIPIFIIMAIFGGLSGALFVQLNYHNTIFRRRFLTKKWHKILEAAFVAACSAIILTVLIYAVPDCQPIKGFHPPNSTNLTEHISANTSGSQDAHHLHRRSAPSGGHGEAEGHADSHSDHHGDPYGLHGDHGYVFRGFCPYGEHNRMADILFKTPEGGLHAMIHAPYDEWGFVPLLVLLLVYHLLATWTYGLMVSSGVFIPSLLIGAIWGRLVGLLVVKLIPNAGTNIARYIIIGAACQLGGTVRMTISLTVIIIECTGDITFGIPIMLSLIIAKWMGDFFNPGIYDLHIEILGIPLLPWDPPEMCYAVKASEMMSTPVKVLRTVEQIGKVVEIMDNHTHNGYPVVEDYEHNGKESEMGESFGRLKGFILRSQLQEILRGSGQEVSEAEMESTIDLRMHMDRAPFTIHENVSLPRIFKLFRGLGLRHLIVVNDHNRVAGVITRINLARFREESVKGQFKLEELEVFDQ
jgi:chloride channel 7